MDCQVQYYMFIYMLLAIIPCVHLFIDIHCSYCRMSVEHIFEVRHIENSKDKLSVNLKDQVCSCRKCQLTTLQNVHAISSTKRRNLRIEEYTYYIYKIKKYHEVYKHFIYHVNGSNILERTSYPNVQPRGFRKMPGMPEKKKNLEQGEIDGYDCK